MVEIPNALAQSIRRGECVLWTGAGLGGLADRPAWQQILASVAKSLDDDDRQGVEALLDSGRLRPVLDLLRRTQAKALSDGLAATDSDGELPQGLASLAKLPWASVFATVHTDLARKVATRDSETPELIAPDDLDGRTLGNGAGHFALHTPADLKSWMGHPDLHDIVQQAAQAHTILLLGFAANDPDLDMVLDTLAQVSSAAKHFALVSGLTATERTAIGDRYGVEVLDSGDALGETIEALVSAGEGEASDDDDVTRRARVGLDLAVVVGELPLRADVGSDAARYVDATRVADYVGALGTKGLAGLGAPSLLRAGSVLLAHAGLDGARQCFDAAAASAQTEVDAALSMFGLAWTDYAEGKTQAALEGLGAAAARHSAAALVPSGYTIEAITARRGALVRLEANNADGERIELEVTTLVRALAAGERETWDDFIDKFSKLEKSAVSGIQGGKARGRRMVVERQLAGGPTLAEGLAGGVLELGDVARLVAALAEGLAEAHGQGLVHGSLTTHDVVLGDAGPSIRGFGPGTLLRRAAGSVGAAPEIASGGTATDKADAYALAMVAFQALTGAAGGGLATALVPELDARVDAALATAMHPDPQARSTVLEFGEALVQIAESPDERDVADATKPVGPPEDPNDLQAWTSLLEAKPTHSEARDAIVRIEREARGAQQWDRVADVLSVRSELTQVVAERVSMLRELSSLFEDKLSVPANAFDTTRRLIDAVEVNEQLALIDDLERLAIATGRWAPFADAVEAVAGRVSDDEAQAAVRTRLGAIHAERLAAPDRAIEAYEKAAELAPGRDTFGPLVPLYRKSMRMAELATTLLSLAEYQEGPEKVTSLLAAVDVLQTDMGETEGAFAALHAVLEIDAEHADALEQSEDLARQLEDWDSLVDLLGRRAEASIDGKQAVQQLREAAQICIEELDQPARAPQYLGKLLDKDRSDGAAADQLAGILRGLVADDSSVRAQLIDTVGILVEVAETPDAKAKLLAEQAGLLDQEVDGRERAADARERIMETVGLDRSEAVEAAESLEKWYRRGEDNAPLLRLLEQMGGAADAEDDFRVTAWSKVLQLRKSGSDEDADRAVDALEKLAALQPDSKEWRDQLLDRYLEREDFKKAGPLIRQQVSDEEDPKRKAELLLRGGLLRGQIGKDDGAIEALEQAVALDDSLYEAWLALRDLYLAGEQPLKAIEAQVRGARGNPNRKDRVRLTFEAATRFLDELGQPERGMTLLEELVEFDPDHREATGMLVQRLVDSGDLERAWPHSQTFVMQVRSQAADDRALNVEALSTAGRCALTVGEPDRARDYLEKARVFDATNLNVLRLLADLSIEAGEYADALRHYQSVVLGVGSKMAPTDLSRLYVHMADARRGMEEPAKAVQMAERALEIDPDNEGAIDKLIELAAGQGGAAALANAKQRHADLLRRRHQATEDEAEKTNLIQQRVKVLHELAKIQAEELKAPVEAVRTLEVLLEVKPDDPGVLHEILAMFTKSERWRDATNVIKRLADAQTDVAHRAQYLWAGALIFRDHLGELEHAMDWVKLVLEADPLNDKAYEAGLSILREGHNFKELARLMRGRLKALPKDAPPQQRVTLFANLGEIYEKHLGDSKTAIAAYNQSVRFATGALGAGAEVRERRLTVMRLAVQLGDDEIDKAIMQGHALISDDPMEFEVYHRLVELYLRRGDRDRARALSRALVFLKQADEAEQNLAAQTGGAASVARRKISRELWRKAVMHRQQSSRVSDIFATVWPMVAAREGHAHAKFGVRRDQRTEVTIQSPTAVSRFLAHACKVIDAPQPDLFLHDEAGGLLVDALVDSEGEQQRVFSSVIAGKEALAEKDEGTLKFIAGRAIARSRPDHILGAMLRDAGSLRATLYGVVAVSLPDAEIPTGDRAEAGRLAEVFRTYLSPSKIEQLGKVAGKVVAQGEFDAKLWLESAAYTVTRAGFVLCDDLQTAARVLTNEGDAGLAVPVKDRVRDLVGYSVSDPYLKLRREIGLAD